MLESYEKETNSQTMSEEYEIEEAEEKKEVIGEGKKESKELENEIKINQLIDKEFNNFKLDLLTDTKAKNELRNERNLSMEKMKDWKLQIKSYGETCEIDLKTGKIYYLKGGKLVEVLSNAEGILSISSKDFILRSSDLYSAFGKMNVINRAMSLAKDSNKKDFYFTRFPDHSIPNGKEFLCVDGKSVLSFKGIKKWFGEDVAKQGILDTFNKLVLL